MIYIALWSRLTEWLLPSVPRDDTSAGDVFCYQEMIYPKCAADHTTPIRPLIKFKMQMRVCDAHNGIWDYSFTKDGIVWWYLYQACSGLEWRPLTDDEAHLEEMVAEEVFAVKESTRKALWEERQKKWWNGDTPIGTRFNFATLQEKADRYALEELNRVAKDNGIPAPLLDQPEVITQEERDSLMYFNTRAYWHCYYNPEKNELYNQYFRKVSVDPYEYLLGIGMIDSENNKIKQFEE